MLLANFNGKEHLRHRAVSLRQHGFLVEIFNVECNAMVDMTLIRPLNEGQGHSFWYKLICHIRLPVGSQ